jgi:hypothetical protein
MTVYEKPAYAAPALVQEETIAIPSRDPLGKNRRGRTFVRPNQRLTARQYTAT